MSEFFFILATFLKNLIQFISLNCLIKCNKNNKIKTFFKRINHFYIKICSGVKNFEEKIKWRWWWDNTLGWYGNIMK